MDSKSRSKHHFVLRKNGDRNRERHIDAESTGSADFGIVKEELFTFLNRFADRIWDPDIDKSYKKTGEWAGQPWTFTVTEDYIEEIDRTWEVDEDYTQVFIGKDTVDRKKTNG